MLDQYIDGISVPAYDGKITKALESVDPDDGGFSKIAIENEAGDVYRIIIAEGIGEIFGIKQALWRIGMRDRLANPSRGAATSLFAAKVMPKSGFECRFHFINPKSHQNPESGQMALF